MIVWTVCGLLVGWLSSTRLRVDGLGAVLVMTIVLPLGAFAELRRFDVDAAVGYVAFWVAVQGSYLIANLVAERAVDGDDRALDRA